MQTTVIIPRADEHVAQQIALHRSSVAKWLKRAESAAIDPSVEHIVAGALTQAREIATALDAALARLENLEAQIAESALTLSRAQRAATAAAESFAAGSTDPIEALRQRDERDVTAAAARALGREHNSLVSSHGATATCIHRAVQFLNRMRACDRENAALANPSSSLFGGSSVDIARVGESVSNELDFAFLLVGEAELVADCPTHAERSRSGDVLTRCSPEMLASVFAGRRVAALEALERRARQ
jgi:hypothetical protein